MKLKSLFAPALAGAVAVLLLVPMVACGGEAEASVERNQNENGSHTTTTKASVKVTWLLPSSTTPPTLNYSVAFMEYPSNRMLLTASAVYPNGLNGSTPGQQAEISIGLTPGLHYMAEYRVGSWTQSYDVVIATQTGLPQGTYVMDCPGMMEDVVMATRNYPNSPVVVSIVGKLGSTLANLLPSQAIGVSPSEIPGSLTITVPGSQTYLIAQTVVSRPDDQVPGNHGPITKTMGD